MDGAPIILVPGFWLGAWAWDEVAETLRADGHDITALTLPGLDSVDTDRSKIIFADHVDAICNAVTAAKAPVVLAVHSGAGATGYAASDRIPRPRSEPETRDEDDRRGVHTATLQGSWTLRASLPCSHRRSGS